MDNGEEDTQPAERDISTIPSSKCGAEGRNCRPQESAQSNPKAKSQSNPKSNNSPVVQGEARLEQSNPINSRRPLCNAGYHIRSIQENPRGTDVRLQRMKERETSIQRARVHVKKCLLSSKESVFASYYHVSLL